MQKNDDPAFDRLVNQLPTDRFTHMNKSQNKMDTRSCMYAKTSYWNQFNWASSAPFELTLTFATLLN